MVSFTIISCIYKDELNYNFKKELINSLINSDLNIVIFTNKETWESYLNALILNCNKENLRIYSKEYYQFFGHYSKIDWDVQRLLDKKEQALNQFNNYTQCIRNYILCNQKLEFIDEINQKNPFNTEYFIWTEIIIDRLEIIKYIDNIYKSEPDKITLFTRSNFEDVEFELYKINNIPKIDYNSTQFDRISDKLIIIQKDFIKKIHDEYYRILLKFPKYKRFVGNSCFNLNYMYILNKKWFHLIKLNTI